MHGHEANGDFRGERLVIFVGRSSCTLRDFDREVTDQPAIDLLRPFPTGEMEDFEVSIFKNNSPELLQS